MVLVTQVGEQIVTGAQIPLSQLRNDAVDNLLGSLTLAGHYPYQIGRHVNKFRQYKHH